MLHFTSGYMVVYNNDFYVKYLRKVRCFLDCIRLSLDCGHILFFSVQGLTALHYAVHGRSKATADFLLSAGASVNAQDDTVWLSLSTALSRDGGTFVQPDMHLSNTKSTLIAFALQMGQMLPGHT